MIPEIENQLHNLSLIELKVLSSHLTDLIRKQEEKQFQLQKHRLAQLAEPDWDHARGILFDESKKAINSFVELYPDETCSFFGFISDYCFGDVLIGFDTFDHSLLWAKRAEVWWQRDFKEMISQTDGWRKVRGFLQRGKLNDYNDACRCAIKFETFSHINFPEWEDYFLNVNMPECHVDGKVVILFWNVLTQLVDENCFAPLKLTSPCRLGFAFHDDELGQVTLRFINWPAHKGPRV